MSGLYRVLAYIRLRVAEAGMPQTCDVTSKNLA